MRPFYNTPQPFSNPPVKPKLTGMDLLYSIEDKHANYLEDCSKGYCKLEPAIVARFKKEIEDCRKTLNKE